MLRRHGHPAALPSAVVVRGGSLGCGRTALAVWRGRAREVTPIGDVEPPAQQPRCQPAPGRRRGGAIARPPWWRRSPHRGSLPSQVSAGRGSLRLCRVGGRGGYRLRGAGEVGAADPDRGEAAPAARRRGDRRGSARDRRRRVPRRDHPADRRPAEPTTELHLFPADGPENRTRPPRRDRGARRGETAGAGVAALAGGNGMISEPAEDVATSRT